MTIAGHAPVDDLRAALHVARVHLGVAVSGSPDPFWDDVRRHVVSWAIIGGISGVGYLAISIPSRIDRVLLNQDNVLQDVRDIQGSLSNLKQRIENLEVRVNRHPPQ